MKAEPLTTSGRQTAPIAEARLEQGIGADDVGLDERGRAVDRAVDVTFGRQVHHRVRSIPREQPVEATPVADVDPLEAIARALGNPASASGLAA